MSHADYHRERHYMRKTADLAAEYGLDNLDFDSAQAIVRRDYDGIVTEYDVDCFFAPGRDDQRDHRLLQNWD